MPPAGELRWPVLQGGPVAITAAGGLAWAHDGYRMHLAGHGPRLETVRAEAVLMAMIEHYVAGAATLHADRVDSHLERGLFHRWATGLDLPLFVWERGAAGTVSWNTPLADGAAEPSGDGTRVVLASPGARTRIAFEALGGALRVADGGRISWTSSGPSRLLALAAEGDADLERSLDLVGRRTVEGLGRQRVQHAEQLHRGGAAMRSSGIPGLSDAFDWAKVRGDALLGRGLDTTVRGRAGEPRLLPLLAEGMLAAGLSQLPRALRRSGLAADVVLPTSYATRFRAWVGDDESAESRPGAPRGRPNGSARNRDEREGPADLRVPALEAIASGRLDAPGLAEFLMGAIGLWGVLPDAAHGEITLAPDAARLGSSAALSRLRIGRSVLDVRFRRQGDLVSVAVRRGAGPPVVVDCGLRGVSISEVLLEGEPIAGSRARFEVRDAHDLQFHLSDQPPLSSPPS